MTTFVGKDVDIDYDWTGGGTASALKVKEFSLEVNNGKKDVWALNDSKIKEFAYTLQSVTGSMTIVAADSTEAVSSLDNLTGLVLPSNALPTTTPVDDMTVVLATSAFTIVIADVSWDSFSFNQAPDGDPLAVELSWTGKSFSIT